MGEVIRLKAARLLAGDGLELIENGAVLVDGGKIVAAGAAEAVASPEGCREIAFPEATLMPGMIDAHLHTFGVDSTKLHTLATEHTGYRTARALHELGAVLRAGFTSARCLGSNIGPQVRRVIDEGLAPGPRLVTAGGFISSTGGTWDTDGVPLSAARGSGELADGPDALRRVVRERVRQGADFIKLGLSKGGVHDRYHAWGDDPLQQVTCYSLAEVQAAVDEAHRNGLKVSAHAIGEAAVTLALDAGIDIIEHGYGISPETRARLVTTQKPVVTTLSQIHFHRAAYEAHHYPAWERAVYERHWDIMLHDLRRGLAAGVRFVLGTDLIGAPTHPLNAAAMEFILATEMGMAPQAALLAGTLHAAEVLGIANDTGSLVAGKRADIIAVPANPLIAIDTLKAPVFVMAAGKVVVG